MTFDNAQANSSRESLFRSAHIVMVGLAIATSVIAVASEAIYLFEKRGLFADFTVFWTAARFADPYNPEAITRAQSWILGPAADLRPFAYPPSALLLLKPLEPLDYTAAVTVWMSASFMTFGTAIRLYGKQALPAWLSPMVGLSILIGQASLLTGGILAAGVALVQKRPAIAGILLGLIGATKPQLAILVPLALICGSHWRVLAANVVSGSVIILVSLLLGPHLWLEWLQSLGPFLNEVKGEKFRTPNMAPGLLFAPIGMLAVAYTWRFTTRPELRLLSLVGGTCLSVPYMMNYDLATMAPAAALLLLQRDWRVWLLGFFVFASSWLSPFFAAGGAMALTYREPSCRAA